MYTLFCCFSNYFHKDNGNNSEIIVNLFADDMQNMDDQQFCILAMIFAYCYAYFAYWFSNRYINFQKQYVNQS